MAMGIGQQIRKHREAQGLTLEQLSDASGVEVGTISALENRDSSRSKFFKQIANGLGLTLDDLESEPGANTFEPLSSDAKRIARSYMRLSPARKAAAEQMISGLAGLEEAEKTAGAMQFSQENSAKG